MGKGIFVFGTAIILIIGIAIGFSNNRPLKSGLGTNDNKNERSPWEIELAKKMEEERLKREEERLKREETLRKSTDDQLSTLIKDCEKQIHDKIYKDNKLYEIYFPPYSPEDLRSLYQMSIAMRTSMGTPSVVLNNFQKNYTKEKIKRIRMYPSFPVEFVVQSAYQTFSGAKGYAAIYKCYLDGLSIADVQESDTFFFEK